MPVIVNLVERKPWAKSFFEHLNESQPAKCAYERLEPACGRATLLSYLYVYTSPTAGKTRAYFKAEAGRKKQALARLSKLVTRTSREADKLVSADDGLHAEIGDSLQAGLRETLSMYQGRLAALQRVYKKRASLKGQNRDEQYLIILWLRIKHRTGSPHYGDLAYILEAAYAGHGREVYLDADAVRKIIKRYKTFHAEQYRRFEEGIAFGWYAAHADRNMGLPLPPAPLVPVRRSRKRKKLFDPEPFPFHGEQPPKQDFDRD